jgi:hypothetical protein
LTGWEADFLVESFLIFRLFFFERLDDMVNYRIASLWLFILKLGKKLSINRLVSTS